MRNKILLGILSVVIVLSVATAVGTYTYAWLSAGQPVEFLAEGSAVAGYFAGGIGTKDDPYILTNAKHVYNLAWLQYLGVFNEVDSSGNLKQQYYFEVANDIDMSALVDNTSYQVIPPIGTTQYPFVGVFYGGETGKEKTISNAIIANEIGSGAITQSPPSVGQEVHNAEIIGFFGVIGEFDGKGVVSEDQLKVLGVSDLKLENVTIQTSTEESLAGLLAGFVNGNLTNVLISSGTITAKPGVSALTGTFGEIKLNPNSALSGYSLIGDYNTTKINWTGGPLDGPTSDSGTNSGFGGSIDMFSLAKRVTYMFRVGSEGSPDSSSFKVPIKSVRDNNHVNAYSFKYNTDFDYENEFEQVLSFRHGTYLPLNIDLDKLSQSNYTSSSTEHVLSTNTGYIVGKYKVAASSQPLSVSGRLVGQLCNSMQGGSASTGAWKNLQYTDAVDNNLQILTIGTDGNVYVIGDTYNGLTSTDAPFAVYQNQGITVQRYDSEILHLTQYADSTANQVRRKLGVLLKQPGMMYGLRFSTQPPNLTTGVTDDKAGVLNLGTAVTLGSKSVNSLVQDSIHFALDGNGVITIVLGTISTNFNAIVGEKSGIQTIYPASYMMPMLYQVERDSDGDIVNLLAIRTICRDNTTGAISYNDTITNGQAPSGKTLLYSFDIMGRLVNSSSSVDGEDAAYMQSLFYFELPVSQGEYVLGGNGTASNFILYLDIGANAGGSGGTTTPGPTVNPTGYINGVYFMDSAGNPITQQVSNEKETVTTAVAFEVKLKDAAGASISYLGSDTNGNLNVVLEPWTGNLDVTLVKAEVKTTKKEDNTTGS